MAHTLRRSAARSTLVSHVGNHHGDRSFLLVRERLVKTAPAEHLALHGVFDQAAYERLYLTLLSLSQDALPLVLDLRGISTLDEGLLARLLKVQRELAPSRSVSFLVAPEGPVLPLIQRLGLEERFGLEPVKRQPLKRTPVPVLVPAVKQNSHDFVTN